MCLKHVKGLPLAIVFSRILLYLVLDVHQDMLNLSELSQCAGIVCVVHVYTFCRIPCLPHIDTESKQQIVCGICMVYQYYSWRIWQIKVNYIDMAVIVVTFVWRSKLLIVLFCKQYKNCAWSHFMQYDWLPLYRNCCHKFQHLCQWSEWLPEISWNIHSVGQRF